MRLTNVLLKQSHRYTFRKLWEGKAKYVEFPLRTPYSDMEGLNIKTGSQVVASNLPKFPKWVPPVPDDPLFAPSKTMKDHPDYHADNPIYEFTPLSNLIEGEKQALLLTKSKPFYELPSTVRSLVGQLELADQDLLVQRIIMQANIWDPTKIKLPRRSNPEMPIWKFKAELGIPNSRIASLTVKNLLRLCESAGGFHPDLMFSRRHATDAFLSTFYYFRGGKHIMIRGQQDSVIYSNRPLGPFASQDEVDESAVHVLPDLFPLAPTIDLDNQHVWRPENITGFKDGYSHPHPHTVVMTYDNTWTTSQLNAKALMFCFGQALASAKYRFGFETKSLPEPIAVQTILTNGIKFHFVCFQLNTLDFESKNGIKNLVWFDSDNALFNKILPKRAMLRNTKYEDYDPEVFKKLMALYINGGRLEPSP